MLKNKYAALVLFVLLFIGLFNLLDWLYGTIVTKSGYSFSVGVDLIGPLAAGIVIGCLIFLRKKA